MARDFNGTNQYLQSTLNTAQNNLTTFSFGGWFYFDSNAQYRRIVAKGAAYPNADWNMEWDDGWGLMFTNVNWSTDVGSWSITKPATGAWRHILVTYDAGSTSNDPVIYLDGVSQTVTERNTPVGTFSNAQTAFYFGTDAVSGGQYNDGRMAEFGMWNRILTAAEANIIGAKSFSPLFVPNGLVMYVPMIGRYSPEIDLIGGSNATLGNSPANIVHPRIIYPSSDEIGRYGTAVAGSAIKTIDGLAKASVKTVNGLAIASVKTWDGLA